MYIVDLTLLMTTTSDDPYPDTHPDPYPETEPNTVLSNVNKPPKFVFIVPYRNREQHRVFFSTYIQKIMEDVPADDWTYYFVNQTDTRPFNRGGMKNIGFLAMKYRYPNDYKNMIFIFNDIDTLPYNKNVLDFNTRHGIIKHYYGFKFALGGIFSVTGEDFEKTSGFPNFWAWGGEDNLIHTRAIQVGIQIDRTVFFSIGDMNILQFADGLKRLICRDELATTLQADNIDGITTIKNLNYQIVDETHMIDVTTFDTLVSPSILRFEEQTIDRIGKIRVNNTSSNSSINQIKNTFFKEINNKSSTNTYNQQNMSSVQKLVSGTLPHQQQQQQPPKTTTLQRQIYQPIVQANLPFGKNNIFEIKNNNNNNNGKGQMYRSPPTMPTYIPMKPANTPAQQGAVFARKNRPDPNIILPVNRPATSYSGPPRTMQNFGMRALFM